MYSELLSNISDFIVDYMGIVAIIFTGIVTICVQRHLKRGINKDNLKDEFRKKKFEALEELNEILAQYLENMSIVISPREECKANKMNYNGVMMKTTMPIFEDIKSAESMVKELNKFNFKNQTWLSVELTNSIQFFVAYLNNYIYYCERGVILPNKLTALILRDDIFILISQVYRNIKKSYFVSTKRKRSLGLSYKSKLYSTIMKKRTKKFYFMKIVNFAEEGIEVKPEDVDSSKKRKLRKKEQKILELLVHASLCKNCKLDCTLKGLYFSNIETNSIKEII